VLGEMRELGTETERGHEEVGEAAAAFGIDHLIGIGELGAIISRAAEKAGLEKSNVVGSTSEAAELLLEIAAPGDLILIKGSRLARTEDVIEAFAKQSSPESARV
jgi:UDP-N-acetylmuramoyl-tripeptide--D-alanyl-D-alanine ligase